MRIVFVFTGISMNVVPTNRQFLGEVVRSKLNRSDGKRSYSFGTHLIARSFVIFFSILLNAVLLDKFDVLAFRILYVFTCLAVLFGVSNDALLTPFCPYQ